MKKVLVIDDSPMYRDFMQKQLSTYGFEVTPAINGLDGISKIRSVLPDVIIMDYMLSRKSSMDVLRDKMQDPNAKDIPIIMASANVDRQKIMEVAAFGVRKFLNKPIKIDALLAALSELLGVEIVLDDTPCLLDAHLNDQILFIEIARGFNKEKINLLQYKVAELLKLYKVQYPRILILMTDITFRTEDEPKLEQLLEEVEKFVGNLKQVKILTLDDNIKNYLKYHPVFKFVEIVKSLDKAVSGLLGIKGLETMTSEQNNVQDSLLSSHSEMRSNEAFQLNFQDESANMKTGLLKRSINIAIVDDDFIIHSIVAKALEQTNWSADYYSDGQSFVDSLDQKKTELLLLDLMMPGMDGFQVLEILKQRGETFPVLILSAMSKKESVMKAKELGIDSYIIKPPKPDGIVSKIADVMVRKLSE